MTLYQKLKELERELIVEALKKDAGRGRMSRVAEVLGISRKSLWEKIRQHQIDKMVEHPQERLAV